MDRFRQFVNPDQATLVMCEWDANHSHWVCDSDGDGRFNLCVPKMGTLYEDLVNEGYQEHA